MKEILNRFNKIYKNIIESQRYKKIKRFTKRKFKKFVYWNPIHKFTSFLLYLYIKLVILTNKKVYLNDREKYINNIQNKKPIIHITWHGRLLAGAIAIPDNFKKDFSVVASKHKDGQYAGEMMEFFNFGNIKGSSMDPKKTEKQKGGLAVIRKMINELKEDRGICLTPDGPRGPKYKIHSESLNIAKMAGGAYIIPFMYSATKSIKFNTWDEFLLPLPFGTIYTYLGDPVKIDKKSTKEYLKEKTSELENILNEQRKRLDKITLRDKH